MKAIVAVLADRRRRQRGSVLSGVLIMTAFVAIIASALMTELSTNFLLSRSLMNRVTNEATVNSALELALNQMQTTPLNGPCPTPTSVNVNLRQAVASYLSCWPTVDSRSPQFRPLALGGAVTGPFSIDGTQYARPAGLNDYLVGNAAGTIYDFTYGFTTPRWTLALGGAVTGPPLVVPDSHNPGQFFDVIPLSGPGCSPSTYCLSVRSDDGSASTPQPQCVIPVSNPVVSQPAAATSNNPGLVYFAAGTLVEAIDVTNGGSQCDWEASASIAGGRPVAAGPVVFRNGSSDFVYAVASDGGSSRLVHFSYKNGSLSATGAQVSLAPSAQGLAVSSVALPSTIAITFAGGQVALVRLQSDGDAGLLASAVLGAGIADAPYWCVSCGNLIGVGGQDGYLYLFDASLTLFASFAGPAQINTTPAVDGGGNWYYGADDGYVYEVQVQAGGGSMSLARRYGQMGRAGSSVQIAGCTTGICVYLGGLDNKAYLIPLNARDAVLTACLTTSPPSCSGENPRLWANVEVGANALRTVHVGGWSYYSP